MKNSFFYLVFLLIITSCVDKKKTKTTIITTKETQQDSSKVSNTKKAIRSKISEPFKVLDIQKLRFTSGRGQEIEEQKKCDSSKTGFYGAYLLISKELEKKKVYPIGGIITIHSKKKMIDWKVEDTDQVIWEIKLNTDVISLWDSIKVGSTRKQIEDFSKANNAIVLQQGKYMLAYDYYNFSASYLFAKNDTVESIKVNRKCFR